MGGEVSDWDCWAKKAKGGLRLLNREEMGEPVLRRLLTALEKVGAERREVCTSSFWVERDNEWSPNWGVRRGSLLACEG